MEPESQDDEPLSLDEDVPAVEEQELGGVETVLALAAVAMMKLVVSGTCGGRLVAGRGVVRRAAWRGLSLAIGGS